MAGFLSIGSGGGSGPNAMPGIGLSAASLDFASPVAQYEQGFEAGFSTGYDAGRDGGGSGVDLRGTAEDKASLTEEDGDLSPYEQGFESGFKSGYDAGRVSGIGVDTGGSDEI